MYTKPDGDQKRVDDRLEVTWVGVVDIDDQKYTCEVTNISTAGAMVKLDVDMTVGLQFLLDVQDLNEYAAEVAWVNRPYYGVKLIVGGDLKLKEHADDVGLSPDIKT